MITGLSLIVRDYLGKYPTLPSRRIMRMITEKYKQYESERVRGLIRYYRGQHGIGDRLKANRTYFDQNYDLPIPSTYDSSDFIIPEKVVWGLFDIQIPFHDMTAIKAALEWGKNYSKKHHKIEAIYLGGDIIDCYQLSVFARDPREKDISEEIEDCRDFLEMLAGEFGLPIYWKFGNHEERFERYLYTHADKLAQLKEYTLENLFKPEKYNCKIVRDKRVIKIGHLNVIHGHEYGNISRMVNPARTFFLKAKAPTLGGDAHITSEHSGRTIDGKLITCWSVGCLCQLKARYRPLNEWNHGFALVKNEGDIFKVLNMRIENGVVY